MMIDFESKSNLETTRLMSSPSSSLSSPATLSSSRISLVQSPKNTGIKLNQNKRVKSLTEILIKYLFSWQMWIEKLEEPKNEDPTVLLNDSDTETNKDLLDPSLLLKEKLDRDDVLRYNRIFMANFNRKLQIKILNVKIIRLQLCNELRRAEEKHLEGKIESLFTWLNKNIFDSVLDNVLLEWSYRLKSAAACTSLVTIPPCKRIVIRFSWLLLTKVQILDIATMLAHEMIHAFLAIANANLSSKHDSSFIKILKKISFILRLDIPIEHEYDHTMDLAYIWRCDKCHETRVRFYNIPPTERQIENHETRCGGKYVQISCPTKIMRDEQ